MLSDVVNDAKAKGDNASWVLLLLLLLGIIGVGTNPVVGNADGGGVRMTRERVTIGLDDDNDDDEWTG